MRFLKYLISIGYIAYRDINNNLVICNDPYTFSTMINGGTYVLLIKENSKFVFGLSEKDKPPTLIFPRTNESSLQQDDAINRFISDNSDIDIFEKLYSYSI